METDNRIFKQEKNSFFKTKSLGLLYIFYFTEGDRYKLRKEIGKAIDEYKADDFIRIYIKYVCFPEESLEEEIYKPDKIILTEEDTKSLSYDELNQFSEIYIADGKVNIDQPKNKGENNIEYLHRLLFLEDLKEKELSDTFKNTGSDILRAANFSKNLQSQIYSLKTSCL